jgi:hypothetical protein
LSRAAASALIVVLVGCASAASAQVPLPKPEPAPANPGFLSNYNFHLSADSVFIDDPRFTWQTHFGGDFDLVDYVKGRANVMIDYEAVLGNQLRSFDPNQGNYTLEVSGSVRAGRIVELAGIYRHESRHLGDREKDFSIAWNVAGVRALRQLNAGGSTIDLQGSVAAVTAKAYVDYSWTSDADAVVRHPVNPHLDVFAHGYGEIIGVDSQITTRGTQTGGRIEGGVRIKGRAGAVELFAGYEKRIDADAREAQPQHWALAGFRFVNR